MGRIEVDIAGLQTAGAHASTLGTNVASLAGDAHSVGAAGGAPPATEGALASLGAAWGAGLATLGNEISHVGAAAGAAATLYQHVDACVMPEVAP
jgi:hypothetical protein